MAHLIHWPVHGDNNAAPQWRTILRKHGVKPITKFLYWALALESIETRGAQAEIVLSGRITREFHQETTFVIDAAPQVRTS